MSTYTDVNADGSSRQHNGNNYNYHYYGTGPQDAGASRQLRQADLSGNSSSDNALKLWRAVKAGQVPRARYLLKSGADLKYRCEDGGTTPLHQAALIGSTELLGALLEAGASVDDEDNEGATALYYASRSDVVVTLIMAGADVDHEDHAGRTPGHRARERSDMIVVQVLLNNHADPSKIHLMIGDGEEARLKQHSELEQASSRTTADLITVPKTDGLSNSKFSNNGPERKLVIGISLEAYLEVAAYALADSQISSGWNIRESHRTGTSTKPPKPVDYGIDSDFTDFGFVLDPDIPGRAGPKAGLIRQKLEANNKTAEEAVALFIGALHNYILEKFTSENPEHSVDNLQSEVIVTTPPNWSKKSRIAIMQAAKNDGLRDVTLIRAAEAAVPFILHCAGDKHTAIGTMFLVCHLGARSASCTGEQVVSLKPFQLRQFGPAEVVHRRPREKLPDRIINIPFYHTKTLARERVDSELNQARLWVEDIRNCIAAQLRLRRSQCKQLGLNDVEAIHLVGTIGGIHSRDFPLFAGVVEDNPGIKLMHRPRQMARGPSVLGTEVVMYGLMNDVGKE